MIKNTYRFVIYPNSKNDPRSAGYLADARALGLVNIQRMECQDLYFIQGQASSEQLRQVANQLLSDPITQRAQWGCVLIDQKPPQKQEKDDHIIEISLLPGVTDPVAEQLVRASHVLGIKGIEKASSGLRFQIQGDLTHDDLHLLTQRLLANHVIHRYAIGEIEPIFPEIAEASNIVETIHLRDLEEEALIALSNQRRAALDIQEMLAVQKYFQTIERDPTDIEFETIAQTWSEHCVHKTFKALISIQNPGLPAEKTTISSLLDTYIKAASKKISAPWVRSSFVDNAGIIEFDDEFEVSFKVETHNHPSALEPFGGANTGVGGVIRDILGVSAKPIAATDILCFGLPDTSLEEIPQGVLHPRRIRSGVVAGVQDYGNKIGIPTVNGAIYYDQGYIANPLVYCGCVGLAPKDSHPCAPMPGDYVVVLGGRTGRDGLRGATFSSMTMDEKTSVVSGSSVQIGDPITEKGLIEVIQRARDAKLYSAITDCGAGGLSSAVGEMSHILGADVDLAEVNLKYPGLSPWEIWLSEAQERMVLAVPQQNLHKLTDICEIFDVAITLIGQLTGAGRLVVRYKGEIVLDLENTFLHNGIPQRQLTTLLPDNEEKSSLPAQASTNWNGNANKALVRLLAHPNIASKADVIRIYDHEVQGGTIIKPLTGAANDGPSDACVLKPIGTKGRKGIVLSNGINPQLGKYDAHHMAICVIDEAIRNAVAVGADPKRIALLDNFCWGDPKRPETLYSLVQAAQGCYTAAMHYHTPFISGKDSLNNEYLGADGLRHAIPPTLLISAIGIIHDITKAVSQDLKSVGNTIYLVGEYQPSLGGSHFEMVFGSNGKYPIPGLPQEAPALYSALHQAIQTRLVRSCHDLSEGGISVTAAEMCMAGRLGMSVNLPEADPATALFGETNGCLLIEVADDDCTAFEACLAGLEWLRIGTVTQNPTLKIRVGEHDQISITIADLLRAWTTH